MNKPLSLPGLLMLPPLIGATDSWVKAIGLALAWVLLIGLYGAGMRLLRPPIEARHHWLASLLLSASLGSCLWLALQAWSYELHQQLSLYLGLLPLQCVVLERRAFPAPQPTAPGRRFLYGPDRPGCPARAAGRWYAGQPSGLACRPAGCRQWLGRAATWGATPADPRPRRFYPAGCAAGRKTSLGRLLDLKPTAFEEMNHP